MFNENPVKGYEKFEDFRKNKRKDQNANTNTTLVPFKEKKGNTLIDDLNL